jgi:hypothetical protein
LIVLWYFLYQRLNSSHTLSQVIADALGGGGDWLSPPEKPLSRQLRSTATTSYSDGRQRLPLKVLQEALRHSAREIRSWAQNITWRGFNVVLLDGSTVRLRPYGDIPERSPAHRCTTQTPYWCLMRVLVGFCFGTGLVLGTAMAASALSEQALAPQLLAQLLPQSLIVADRNFGVFSVVQAAAAARTEVLLRLTEVRARRLARCHQSPLRCPLDLDIRWTPTRHDKTDSQSPVQAVAGRLLVLRLQRRGFRHQLLYLFTSLTDRQSYCPADLLELYGVRWNAELNLRYVKTQLQLEALECKSLAMAEKEWVAGLLAYNLIRSVMVAAAAKARLSVYVLSFTRTRDFLWRWLPGQCPQALGDLAAWQRLLHCVAHCRHPRRKKPRPNEPRAKRGFAETFLLLKGDRALARMNIKPKS